jgi:transposase
MIRINFTEDEVKQLREGAYSHPHKKVRKKMHCLLLKSKGLKHHEIGEIAGVCQDTLRDYFEEYIEGGIEELKTLNLYRPKSELEDHREIIEEDFTSNPPATLKEAADRIEKLTGIRRSENRISVFF